MRAGSWRRVVGQHVLERDLALADGLGERHGRLLGAAQVLDHALGDAGGLGDLGGRGAAAELLGQAAVGALTRVDASARRAGRRTSRERLESARQISRRMHELA